jgi:protein-S-isoprenylcysteine O-methyltransferase Ste14
MQPLVIWLVLVAAAGLIALSKGRRRLVDAWPAYLFALPLATRIWRLFGTQTGPVTVSPHQIADLLQQIVFIGFFGLLVALFAIRSPVSGPQATRTQGLVALVGTFILNVVGFLPIEPTTSTTSLLLSSGIVLTGTAFAVWSLAILGRCFGLFPEVRGLVLRGPYRWVRHPVYLGEIVAGAGVVIARPHLLTLGLLVTFVAFQYWRTVFEERALMTAFTSEYAAYRALVGRLVPGMNRRMPLKLGQVPVG